MSGISVRKLVRLISRLLVILGIMTALLFLPAGRWDWRPAWTLIFSFGAFFLLYAFRGIYRDPEQLQERSRMAGNVKRWDKIIMTIYTALLPTVFILAGFDAG